MSALESTATPRACSGAMYAIVPSTRPNSVALAGAFKTDVNGLPLSMILSWYEQKACVILLTLLSLGVKKIRLGPSLPAFVTPTVLQALVTNFALAPVTTPDADLKAIFDF